MATPPLSLLLLVLFCISFIALALYGVTWDEDTWDKGKKDRAIGDVNQFNKHKFQLPDDLVGKMMTSESFKTSHGHYSNSQTGIPGDRGKMEGIARFSLMCLHIQ